MKLATLNEEEARLAFRAARLALVAEGKWGAKDRLPEYAILLSALVGKEVLRAFCKKHGLELEE